MFGLPNTTEYNKKVSKEALYRNSDITNKIKTKLNDEIDNIIWVNKISKDTINIADGKTVKEVEFLLINNKIHDVNEKIIEFIDKNIPYHTVLCFKYEDEYKLAINFKILNQVKKDELVLTKYYYGEWVSTEPIIDLIGNNIDKIYYNIFKNISKLNFDIEKVNTEIIKKIIDDDILIKKLNNEIDILRKKRDIEKQDNFKQELNVKIKKLLVEIEKIKG